MHKAKVTFGLPKNRLVRLVFLAGTVFFSHNNSTRTVFFSQFQQAERDLTLFGMAYWAPAPPKYYSAIFLSL